jgi:calcineurin-like phosphoesterase family protein
MNEALIANWNSVVKPGDDVYELGDFAFLKENEIEKILNRLNGNIYHIWGNHDKVIMNSNKLRSKFKWCKDYHELSVGEQKICLFHYPIGEWNKCHRGNIHLHGHCHGSYPHTRGKMMDVGVPCINYTPINLDEVLRLMKDKPLIEHH